MSFTILRWDEQGLGKSLGALVVTIVVVLRVVLN
jgi:hypothetical protein